MNKRERYTIEHDSYDAVEDALTLDVDCEERGRCYRVTWQPEHCTTPMAVIGHWENDGDGCTMQTHDLDPLEVWELERWISASDDVEELICNYRRDEREAMAS